MAAELKLYQKLRFSNCKATVPSIPKSVYVLLTKSCPEFWFFNQYFDQSTHIFERWDNSFKKVSRTIAQICNIQCNILWGKCNIYRKISVIMQIYFYFLYFMRKEIHVFKFVPTIKQIIDSNKFLIIEKFQELKKKFFA